MRVSILFLIALCFNHYSLAQVVDTIQSTEDFWTPLLATSHWEETSPDSRKGYVLTLDAGESFTEDAGTSPNRKYQFLRGRWILDTAAHQLTLAVDGLMGGSAIASRYLRGRDYYLDYDIVLLTTDTLELKDLLTGETRIFQRTEAAPFKDPMLDQPVKLELPGAKGGLKLPKGW